MACYALNAAAQQHEPNSYIYLYSDSVINAKRVTFRPDFTGNWQLKADSRRIPNQQVKFFSNDDGFFANTRKVSMLNQSAFAERVIEGKLNLFRDVIFNAEAFHHRYHYSTAVQPEIDQRMYYNMGYDDLKKVNYRNLKRDLADNPVSMNLLNVYRKKTNATTILFTAAGASVIAGMISFLSTGMNTTTPSIGSGFGGQTSSFKSDNFTASYLLLGAGVGLGLGGVVIHLSKTRQLEAAFESYNR
ncbi:MAG: hypothetical protein V4687_15150 [Bacteroidota bacterium]